MPHRPLDAADAAPAAAPLFLAEISPLGKPGDVVSSGYFSHRCRQG
jgi:hypothetical protein